jgi:hypothetical protein
MTAQMARDQIGAAMAKTNDLFNTEVFARRNFDALDKIYTADAASPARGAHDFMPPRDKRFLVEAGSVDEC